MKKLFQIVPWLALWCAFVGFGVWMRMVQPWEVPPCGYYEIYGLDYLRYSQLLGHTHMIGYAAFRHPLYGWLLSPFILLGHRLHQFGEWPYWIWLICLFSTVMLASVFLIYRLACRLDLSKVEAAVCAGLFASFAYVWFLAVCPESFGLSCLLSLAILSWGLGSADRQTRDEMAFMGVPVKSPGLGRRLDWAGWGLLAILSGGITSTQGVKAALAYLATHRITKKLLVVLALGIVGAFALVALVFTLRMMGRTESGRYLQGFLEAKENISMFFAHDGITWGERFHQAWVFFSDPIVTRGAPLSMNVLKGGYSNLLAPVLVTLALVCATVGVWLGCRTTLVKMVGAMFLLDFGLHFVLFWGMDEAQIYAGHWFYAVPLLAGLVCLHLKGVARKGYVLLLGLLAGGILACNLWAFTHLTVV